MFVGGLGVILLTMILIPLLTEVAHATIEGTRKRGRGMPERRAPIRGPACAVGYYYDYHYYYRHHDYCHYYYHHHDYYYYYYYY